jgi:hypothetical protein
LIFGLLQIALGVAILALAYAIGAPGWVLVWPAWSVILVGAGYLGLGARVFGKRREDGALSPWIVLLLFPYFAVAWTLWQLKSRLSAEAAWHEVAPGLRLGRRPRRSDELPPDTRCVVDLTSELPRALPELGHRYLCLPTLDTSVASDAELAALLLRIEAEPGPLFVHCAMGHGRSATVAAALLIRRGLSADLDEAVAHLKRIRPGVHLHAAQRAAVRRLAAMDLGARAS